MYLGQIVEIGPRQAVFGDPQHRLHAPAARRGADPRSAPARSLDRAGRQRGAQPVASARRSAHRGAAGARGRGPFRRPPPGRRPVLNEEDIQVRHTVSRMLLAAALAFGAAGAAQAAKDLVVGLDANLTGLDPADLNDNLSQSAARLMFEGLYMLDEHMKLRPQLAESYEASEDAKEFIFHLRKGVTFHDGTPFNAAAVKFSFDRAGNPENHLKRQSLYVMIDHTDVVDDYTVKMVLKYPFGAFVNDIAHPGALIVSPKSVQDYGKEVTRHPVRHRPVPVRELERRHAEDEEERALLEAGPAEDRHHHLSQRAGERRAHRHAAGGRGAVHLSGAAGDDQAAGEQPDRSPCSTSRRSWSATWR